MVHRPDPAGAGTPLSFHYVFVGLPTTLVKRVASAAGAVLYFLSTPERELYYGARGYFWDAVAWLHSRSPAAERGRQGSASASSASRSNSSSSEEEPPKKPAPAADKRLIAPDDASLATMTLIALNRLRQQFNDAILASQTEAKRLQGELQRVQNQCDALERRLCGTSPQNTPSSGKERDRPEKRGSAVVSTTNISKSLIASIEQQSIESLASYWSNLMQLTSPSQDQLTDTETVRKALLNKILTAPAEQMTVSDLSVAISTLPQLVDSMQSFSERVAALDAALMSMALNLPPDQLSLDELRLSLSNLLSIEEKTPYIQQRIDSLISEQRNKSQLFNDEQAFQDVADDPWSESQNTEFFSDEQSTQSNGPSVETNFLGLAGISAPSPLGALKATLLNQKLVCTLPRTTGEVTCSFAQFLLEELFKIDTVQECTFDETTGKFSLTYDESPTASVSRLPQKLWDEMWKKSATLYYGVSAALQHSPTISVASTVTGQLGFDKDGDFCITLDPSALSCLGSSITSIYFLAMPKTIAGELKTLSVSLNVVSPIDQLLSLAGISSNTCAEHNIIAHVIDLNLHPECYT